MTVLENLDIPVIAAPMAGGPSTPALVNAAADAGGLGFLAGGVCSVEELSAQMDATTSHFGVNLFSPQIPYWDLKPVRKALGVSHEELPDVNLTNGWSQKLAMILDHPRTPAVVSSMFGTFTAAEMRRLHDRGIEAWVTVTNEHSALAAVRAGADALIVQGPSAGGHRGTWSVQDIPDLRSLPALLKGISKAVNVPLIAAGGIMGPNDVPPVTERGAVAVAVGTALLRTPEAGTSQANRELLVAGERDSVSTRAFSGRWARGLETEFTREHPEMPPTYPYLNALLAPRRSEPGYEYCLAGENYRAGREAPAGEIMREIATGWDA
ncbi:NAD(P)H-dependent flavin oxidoreductase [Corynebacterium renale]|uniref:NAD(P)H-dependent flavin oxidoreductase n=1 Tax=Corynebacterium renale TaxID=1724 RepID=UPI000653E38B|nr:nitronate monooxygenase [Corynebacterium renale]